MRLVSFLAEAWSVSAPDEALTWVVHGSAAVALTALSVALMNPGFLVRFRRLILELSRLASTVILGVVGLQVYSFTGLEFEPDITRCDCPTGRLCVGLERRDGRIPTPS